MAMTRRAFAIQRLLWLLALAPLLACSAPSETETVTEPASAPEAAPKAPVPKRTREPMAPRRSNATLRAGSGYFQYVDETGRVRFASTLDEVPERQRSTAGRISLEQPTARAQAPRQVLSTSQPATNSKPKVVLYTTESCPWCKRAIAFFDKTGQEYENKDVEHDDDARDEYLKITNGNTGVPVVVIGDQWMQGWNEVRAEQMLAAVKPQP
jgi:glutaredoxin 3